jgi:hypothetical protein
LKTGKLIREAPRSFEQQPGPILQAFRSDKYVSDKQLFFEKAAVLHQPLLKTSQGYYRRFLKVHQIQNLLMLDC